MTNPLTPNYREYVRILDAITSDLVAWQHTHDDGGWSSSKPGQGVLHASAESEVWLTAEVIYWLLQYDPQRYKDAIQRGLSFLASTQHIPANGGKVKSDGGWGWRIDRESEATGTALALVAFLEAARVFGLNNEYARSIEQGRDWLINNVSNGAGFGPRANLPATAINTCWGCIALRRCEEMDRFKDPAISTFILPGAIKLIEEMRKAEGWGGILFQPPDALGTAYATYLLLQMLPQDSPQVKSGLAALRHSQRDDGSWDAGPTGWVIEATAWATHTQLLGGIDPRSPMISTAIRFLRDLYVPHKGWPETVGGEFRPWTTVFVCLAMLQYIDALRHLDSRDIGPSRSGRKVFIVHGHDHKSRDNVKSYLEQLALEPVILEDEAHGGITTIWEKFQRFANQDGVDYAVVLCTPDDLLEVPDKKGPRRNVLFELGVLVGRLGPERVCLMSSAKVELPTDLEGVAYIDLDADWIERLKRELRAAGLIE